MKKITLFFTAILFAVTGVLAQTPNQFKYQAVLRNADGTIMAGEAVTVDISILQGSATGTSVFDESHSVTTTAQGLINLNIGSEGDMSVVNWNADTYFIEISVNSTVMGTSQLLSVPYAMTAKTVENDQVDDADADPINELQDLTLNGTILEISDGTSADLSSLQDGTGTDNQNLTGATLTGTSLEIAIEDGSSATVDLAGLQDGTGTDDQNISGSGLSGTTLTIGIEGGNNETVDLSSLQDGVGDGSETKVTAGTNITVTGNGTSGDPYIVNATTYSVGDFAHGGIVFWVNETGQHGLVCTKVDQAEQIRWYAGTYGVTRATGDEPYAGEMNTAIIIAAQVSIGDDGSDYAAQICNELQITENGKTYGDWYLPSIAELTIMYNNRGAINSTATSNGGVALSESASVPYGIYWSSTEYNSIYPWHYNFNGGYSPGANKTFTYRVRAVRAF